MIITCTETDPNSTYIVFFLESKTPPTLQITKMIVPNEITGTLGEQSGHKAAELQVLPELAGLCPLSPFFVNAYTDTMRNAIVFCHQ